jgi:hypothetical protein
LSKGIQLDKQRLLFTQFNGDFAVRCPICLDIKKIIRHCKVYRNFHAAWCHVKRDHNNEPKPELDRVIETFNSIFDYIKKGVIPYAATSSSANQSGFRRDMHQKLVNIAVLLKGQSNSYPADFKIKQLFGLIKVVLGKVDDRTRKKYLDIIISMSEKNIQNGTINVIQFCNTFAP